MQVVGRLQSMGPTAELSAALRITKKVQSVNVPNNLETKIFNDLDIPAYREFELSSTYKN